MKRLLKLKSALLGIRPPNFRNLFLTITTFTILAIVALRVHGALPLVPCGASNLSQPGSVARMRAQTVKEGNAASHNEGGAAAAAGAGDRKLPQRPDPSSAVKGAVTSGKAALKPKPQGLTLDSLVQSWLKREADLKHSLIGIEVMEVPSGQVLYSYNGERRFVTASTAKVLTTAFAYETLGGGYTYKTQLQATGPLDGPRLKGDLVVAPSQDPTLTRENLHQLLAALNDKKIKQVDGTVRIEDVAGGSQHFFNGWLPEDWGQSWMPVCSNLVVDRNVAQGVTAFKGAKVVVVPLDAAWNAMMASLMNSEEAAAWVSYDPMARELKVYLGRGTTIKSPLCVANPDEYNIGMIDSMLQDMGVKVGVPPLKALLARIQMMVKVGAHDAAATPPATAHGERIVLAEHQSKPLSAIIQTTLHESDNLYAQQLLRTTGLLTPDEASKMTAARAKELPTIEDRGLYRLSNWLAKIGVPTQEAVLFDGCGLSRKNCIAPHALNAVLNHMAAAPGLSPYLSLLRVSGEGQKGSFHYKTGSMDSVSSIAGILQTRGGQTLAVSVIVNGHTPSIKRVRGEETELVSLLSTINSIGSAIDKSPAQTVDLNTAPPLAVTTIAPPLSGSHHRSSHRRKSSKRRP